MARLLADPPAVRAPCCAAWACSRPGGTGGTSAPLDLPALSAPGTDLLTAVPR
ncbi:hypothetical protein [Streptomyces massasporeus]|uniref:hypothetical protein n=1 Tax=Streptomyces massasporeus TaxID=67324 RepID=UPI003408E755